MSGTSAPVAFSFPGWSARYPELLATVSEPLAVALFDEAGALYLDNTLSSPIAAGQRSALLGMVVAHLAVLASRDATIVGRLSDASEGSISTAFEMGPASNSSAFWMQTRYGAMFWQATASLRTARYVPGLAGRRGMWPWPRFGSGT